MTCTGNVEAGLVDSRPKNKEGISVAEIMLLLALMRALMAPKPSPIICIIAGTNIASPFSGVATYPDFISGRPIIEQPHGCLSNFSTAGKYDKKSRTFRVAKSVMFGSRPSWGLDCLCELFLMTGKFQSSQNARGQYYHSALKLFITELGSFIRNWLVVVTIPNNTRHMGWLYPILWKITSCLKLPASYQIIQLIHHSLSILLWPCHHPSLITDYSYATFDLINYTLEN